MSTAVHWFRRDLRLTDHPALTAALAAHEVLVPVYVVSRWRQEHRWTGPPRQEFLCGCLRSLAAELETKGGRLIVRRGPAVAALEKLLQETGASALYCHRDPDPFGRKVEGELAALCARRGVAFHALLDVSLHPPDAVLTGSGKPFRVFSPYAKAWLKLEQPAPGPPVTQIFTPPEITSDPLPTLATWGLRADADIVEPGEAAARRRLSAFLDGPALVYGGQRNAPAAEATSRLSQDLRHGTLSIREVYARAAATAETAPPAQRRGAQIYLNELIWREFYLQVLWHWPEVLAEEFQPDYRGLKWRDDPAAFEAWKTGMTGFPIVDAGLRQLAATGFMHNRLRMIVAMFLTKDLHLDWRLGESWFMQRLTDGEIASNNGGWQWSASTGTDAAPYFRIQNPWLQTRRFDPEGAYIRRWVPELCEVPAAQFFQPPTEPRPLAEGYPMPMRDHFRERDLALEMYRK